MHICICTLRFAGGGPKSIRDRQPVWLCTNNPVLCCDEAEGTGHLPFAVFSLPITSFALLASLKPLRRDPSPSRAMDNGLLDTSPEAPYRQRLSSSPTSVGSDTGDARASQPRITPPQYLGQQMAEMRYNPHNGPFPAVCCACRHLHARDEAIRGRHKVLLFKRSNAMLDSRGFVASSFNQPHHSYIESALCMAACTSNSANRAGSEKAYVLHEGVERGFSTTTGYTFEITPFVQTYPTIRSLKWSSSLLFLALLAKKREFLLPVTAVLSTMGVHKALIARLGSQKNFKCFHARLCSIASGLKL